MNRKHGRFKRLFALFLVLVMLATSGNGYSMQAVAAGIDETVQTEQTDGAAPQNTQPQTSQTTAPQSSESQNTQPQTSQTTAPQSSEPQNTQPQTTAPQSSEPENTQPQTSQTTAPQSSGPESTQPQTSQTTAPQSGEPESTQPQTDQTAGPADNGQSGADNGANGISLMSTEPGSGINIDVTSRLLIDGNKSHVLAGEDFQLQIQYSVPKLGADQGTEYSGAYIQFSLPLYVKLKTTGVDSEGKPVYSIDGKEYSRIDDSQADKGIYYIYLAEAGTLETQQTNTLNIGLTTENLVTPDSRELNFNSFRFNVSYLTENNDKKNVELPVPGSATVVKASADWQIEKTITSSQDGHAYVRQDGSDCFEVTYRVTVSDKAGVNRLGRLGFESYSVTDTLPANLPSGGQAQEITDVKILHGGSGQDMALAEGEDYTIVQSDDGHPAGITFKTADTVRDGEAGQYQEAGDVTNTTYEYTVKYPYEPYTTESTEPEIMTYTLENTAELDYTLHGENAKQKTDTAAFDIAAYEDGVASADVTVKKQLSIGGETFILDSGYSDKYSGTVTFTLYKNEDCTEVAYNINRQPMQDIAVGADGTATFNDVRFGTYYIKETRTLPGFKAADKVKVVIDENGSVYFSDSQTSADEPYIVNNEADTIGMLTFTKKGSDAYGNKDQELSGATFTLTAVDGGKAYTAASDGSGKVVFHNLPAGKYTLKETALTEELIEKGYTLSDKTFEVEIKGNEISRPDLDDDNVFNNESPKGLLKITKIDGQAKENRLSGAVFEVYGPYATEDEALKASGSPDTELKAATLTTGKNGEVTSGPLAKGFYVLVETSAPANYTAGEPAVVEVEAKKTVMITIENIPQARVTFSKAGAEKEGEPVSQELAGAVFEIYDANEHLLYGVKDADGNYTDVSTEPEGRTKVEITTQLDSTGKSTSPYVTLAPGTYYYKEIKAPAPYMPDSQLHSFTVAKVKTDESSEWNIAQTVTVYNYLSTGQIRIMKSTADGKATASAVNGAVFGVYGSEEDAAEDVNRIDTITTDTYVVNETPTNGVGYSTAALTLGTIYYVREISAPAGYAINTEVFEVQCTADNKIQEIECVNQPTVSIKIIKTDSVTKEALNGVTFELWSAKEEDGGKKLAEGQTEDGGVLTFGDLSPATTYYIKETKTVDGYVLDGQWHEVKTKAYDSSSSDLTEEVAITNVPKGNLIVEKWDTFNADREDDYKQMSGVEFELYSVGDDNAADFGADQSKTKIDEKKTGKDGRVTWDNLEPGDYWLVEHYPEGYEEIDNSGKITAETEVTRVTVAAGQNKGSDYSAKIEKIENSATYGKLTLGKYGATANGSADMKTPLSDVEFTVYTDAECEEAKATLTTGADGTVTSGWLVPGTYYIKETKADGYVLLEDVYKVTVAANKVTDTAVVVGSDPEATIKLTELVNEKKGGFTIKKYGLYLPASDTGTSSSTEILEQLSGAEFTLYVYDEADGALGDNGLPKGSAALPEDVSGREVVKTFKMENYTQTISGIAPGLYWLRETKTPDDTWDRVDDMLICILPDGTTKYGTVKEEGVTWSGAAVTPAIELKDDSNKPRIRFIKKVYGEETRIDGAEFELYVADEKGTPTEVSINGEKETVNLTKVGGSIDSGTARDPETGEAISGEAITPKLEPGKTYYLKEVSLKGDLNNYYFYFDEENCWTKIEIPANAKGEEYTTTIYNYRKVLYPGQKYDAEKNTPLSGAVLALFDNKADAQAMVQRLKTEYNEAVENKRLKQSDVVNADGTLTKLAEEWNIEQISVSDGSGKFEFSNLFPEKTYYIVEIVAPNKYQLEKDENGDYVIHTVVPNVGDAIKNEGPFASVDGNTSVHYLSIGDYDYNAIWLDKISVLSGQEYKITGAEFTIYGAKIVNDEAVPDTDNVIGTMNESSTTGLYMSNYLPNGTYFIAETKYPEGFEEAERGALSEEAQEIFGSGYDYVEVDGVRYYKVELGRTSDNTWFKAHPVYNKAQNGRFVLTKRSLTDEAQKISATFTIEKYNDTAKVFETYAAYPSITTETYSEYVTSNFLEPGIYRLTETQVSGDYTMSTEPVYIEIKAGKVTDASGETSTEQITIDGKTTDISVYTPSEKDIETINPITVTNVPKGKFWVHKTGTWNEESQGNLEGVTFEVYKKLSDSFGDDSKDAEPADSLTTNENGEDSTIFLDAGDYWLIETSAGKDNEAEFGKNSYEPQVVTVTAGAGTKTDGNTVKIENTSNYGKFQVTKQDAYDDTKLSGAEFKIYTDKDCTEANYAGTMTDNKDGTYTSPFLPPTDEKGDPQQYWLKETKAPEGYSQNKDKKFGPYTVEANKLTTVETALENDHDNTLTVKKYEKQGEEQTETLITTSNAYFALYTDQSEAETAKLDSDGKATGSPVREGYTSNGQLTWTGLADGTYYLKELKAPEGYVLDEMVHEVTLDNTPEAPETDRVYVYTEEVYNLLLGGFRLDKTVTWSYPGQAAASIAGSGITFKLYEGKEVNEDNFITTLTTDSSGHISYRLEAGDYTLAEDMTGNLYARDSSQFGKGDKEAGNYIDNEGNIHIHVKASEINTYFTDGNAINNTANYGRFQLSKKTKQSDTDKEGLGISGAKYTLEKYVGGHWYYFAGGNADSSVSAEDSKFTVTSEVINGETKQGVYISGTLPEGKYRVTEVEAPTSISNGKEVVSFTVDSKPIEFEIKAGETVDIEQYDGILRRLEVSKKTDILNGSQALAGVSFELWTYKAASEEGLENDYDKVTAHKDKKIGETQTTGSDGRVLWQGLTPGRYVLVETAAPEGYALTAKIITIEESSSYLDVAHSETIVNDSVMGRIRIRKTDANGNEICNASDGLSAVFKIYAASDTNLKNPLDTVTVSKDGGLSSLLPVGDYWVVEVTAPNGYPLDDRLEQNILKKKVTVSGTQVPTSDFTGVSATEDSKYTDKVIFQNRREDSVKTFTSTINKQARLEGVSGYTDSAASGESLMNTDIHVWFNLSELTSGKNELPAEQFVVTDDTIVYQYLVDTTTDNYEDTKEILTSSDYTMDEVRLYKSVNGDAGKAVSATIEAKVETTPGDSDSAQWETVRENINLSGLPDGGYTAVSLPENAVGYRISYANVLAGFKAGNIEVKVTFKQRPSDVNKHEVRKIVNTASLDWEDTAVDHEGKAAHNTGNVKDTASVTLAGYGKDLPYLSLGNKITNMPEKGYFYSGDDIEFQTTGMVSDTSKASLKHPIMSITLPPYTTLDTSVYEDEGIGGIRARIGSSIITDFTLSEPIEVEEDGRKCWKYVLDFGEDFELESGESIVLDYTANISLTVPDETIRLESSAYITSGYQLPLTIENPTGMSYQQMPGDSSATVSDEASDGFIEENGTDIEGGELTYLEQPVSVSLTRSDSLQIQKSIAVENGQWLNTGVTATVKPADTIYYRLTLVNAGSDVKEARFVDIVPFTGDTQELRALNNSGVLSRRSTSLPENTAEHTYEPVTVLWVNGNPDGVEGAHATVYYYVGGSWDPATRLSKTTSEELPMLSSKADDVWGGWTTSPSDMSQVTAIGVEVTFDEGYYLEAGDVYNVTLAMRAPGYTAEEMNDYADAVIGNTTAAAVVREGDTAESQMLASDRVSSNEVLAKMYITTGSIGDYAFYDKSGNGIQDDGDRPARNVKVTLYRRKATFSDEGRWKAYKTTFTDTEGKYLFDGLACNYRTEASYGESSGYGNDPDNPKYYVGGAYYEYKVAFDIPDGYGAAIRYAGDNRAMDSNINADGGTDAVSLALTVGEDGVLTGEDNMTIDAGFVTLVNLGDYVWIDSNKNGVQDESESGLNGVTVNLYKLDSEKDTIDEKEPYATQMTATNDATGKDGYYCFTNLPQGYYVVEFDISDVEKTGYTSHYSFTVANAGSSGADSDAKHSRNEAHSIMYTDVIELTADDMTWDAGVTVYSALGGFVFDDQDYDNTQSIYIPLPGTRVDLYTVDGDGTASEEPIASTVVGEDGMYLFDRLEAGRYKLHFQYPENYISVTAGVGDAEHDSEVEFFDDENMNGGFTDVIELAADTADLTHDAGAYLLSAIGDYVWVDANKNGLQDAGEAPVQGIVVTLQQKAGDGEWETVSTAVTDAEGLYKFSGIKSSEHYDVVYRVTFDISRLVSITRPNQGDDRAIDSNALYDYELGLGYLTEAVKPGYGQEDMTIDAGIVYNNNPCTIGDYVWYDKDQDGIQDEGETGVEGISVILQYCESGNVWEESGWETVARTVTSSDGKYLFTGLPSGYYRVGFAIGEPWTVTLTHIGDSASDSNATQQSGEYYYSTSFYMNPGQTDLTWDAGIFRSDEKKHETITQTVINRVVTTGRRIVRGVRTGDPTCIGLLAGIAGASAAVIVYIIYRKKRKKSCGQ